MTNAGDLIPGKVTKKLVLSTPSAELVDAYLFEIAKGYGVSWSPPKSHEKEGGGDVEPKGAERDAKVRPIFRRSHPFHVPIYANIINNRSTRRRSRQMCWIM